MSKVNKVLKAVEAFYRAEEAERKLEQADARLNKLVLDLDNREFALYGKMTNQAEANGDVTLKRFK